MMIFKLDKYPDPGDTTLYAAIKRIAFHKYVSNRPEKPVHALKQTGS